MSITVSSDLLSNYTDLIRHEVAQADMRETIEPLADTIEGTLTRLGISRSTCYREIAAGRLRAVKVRNRTLVTRADQLMWLNSLRAIGEATAA